MCLKTNRCAALLRILLKRENFARRSFIIDMMDLVGLLSACFQKKELIDFPIGFAKNFKIRVNLNVL
jgi:hypothetical protein